MYTYRTGDYQMHIHNKHISHDLFDQFQLPIHTKPDYFNLSSISFSKVPCLDSFADSWKATERKEKEGMKIERKNETIETKLQGAFEFTCCTDRAKKDGKKKWSRIMGYGWQCE